MLTQNLLTDSCSKASFNTLLGTMDDSQVSSLIPKKIETEMELPQYQSFLHTRGLAVEFHKGQ